MVRKIIHYYNVDRKINVKEVKNMISRFDLMQMEGKYKEHAVNRSAEIFLMGESFKSRLNGNLLLNAGRVQTEFTGGD